MSWTEFCVRSDRRWPARAIVSVVLACLVAGASSCTMRDLTAVSDKHFPPAARCGECHVEIYREWADSPHANAYVNPRYREATDDYDFDGCLPCHAPKPQYSDKAPQVRMTSRQTGVTCVSCHLHEGKMVGPHEPTPVGVFRAVQGTEYAEAADQQLAAAQSKAGAGELEALLRSGATWTVEG